MDASPSRGGSRCRTWWTTAARCSAWWRAGSSSRPARSSISRGAGVPRPATWCGAAASPRCCSPLRCASRRPRWKTWHVAWSTSSTPRSRPASARSSDTRASARTAAPSPPETAASFRSSRERGGRNRGRGVIRGRALAPDAVRGRRADFSVLDVREEAAFRQGHIAGSGHVPRSELRLRRSELPPREQPLLVVAADGPEAAAAAAELNALGFASVAWLDAPLAALEGGLADQSPAARLWRPAPFLEEMQLRIPRPRPDACAALDAAAGAGREAVYLALQGFQVEARDRDPEALARAAAL